MKTKWYKYLPLAPAFILGLVLGKALQSEFGIIGWAAGFVMAVAFEAVNLALAEHTAEHANHRRFKFVTTTIIFQIVYIGVAFAAIALLGDGGTTKWFLALTPAIIGLALISGGLLQSVDAKRDREQHEKQEADEIEYRRKLEADELAHRRKMEEQAQANEHRQALKAIGQSAQKSAQPSAQQAVHNNGTDSTKQAVLADYAAGNTNKSALARAYNVHRNTVTNWLDSAHNGNGKQ